MIAPSTYNYVIFGSDWDFYKKAYHDVLVMDNVKYVTSFIPNSFLRKIRNFHLSESINKIISLPFKNIWNPIYYHNDFPYPRMMCFIVFYDWYVKNHGFLEFLRKTYPKSKIVTVFHDLIETKRMSYTGTQLDIPYLKSLCDLVITYDFKEAIKYDLLYHAIPYSDNSALLTHNKNMLSDVYFLGQAKNRLSDIMSIYYKLKEHDLKLNFILSGVPVENRVIEEGITYLDSTPISYDQNLEYISNTRCILEIIQHNSTGYTSRTLEAIAFNKLLLSNNTYLKDAPFFNPSYISIIDNNNIDNDFISSLRDDIMVDYKYKEKLSPVHLINFIQKKLVH